MRRSCSTLLVIALLFALGLFAQEQPPSDKPQENPPQDQNANKKEKKKSRLLCISRRWSDPPKAAGSNSTIFRPN